MVLADYKCTQQELYTVARLGWNSCGQHIVEFGNLKGMYDAALVTTRLNEIAAAKAMPDDQARGEISESLRKVLLKKNKVALDIWQRLSRYIASGWSDEFQKAKLEGAGHDNYEAASNNDWDKTEGLLSSGSNFIDTYTVELSAGNNMPATFPAAFDVIKDDFLDLHQRFLNSRETSAVGTENKVKANNVVYNNLMVMLLDGQYIFKDSPATQKQFIFADLMIKASGAGTAGIKGTVTDAVTHLPIKDVDISLVLTVKTGKTDEDGKYEINQVAHGEFDIEVSKAGYQTRIIEDFEILIGTVSTLDIELAPEP